MLPEYITTISNLWTTVKGKLPSGHVRASILKVTYSTDFMGKYPEYVPKHNAMDFISNDGGENYNMCHCEHFL
jgi:hypothetical protein